MHAGSAEGPLPAVHAAKIFIALHDLLKSVAVDVQLRLCVPSSRNFFCLSGCVIKLLLGTGNETDYQRSSLQVTHCPPLLLCSGSWELSAWFSLSLKIIEVPFPNWVRRNRPSMPTKYKRRKKRKRRPELNTRSPKRHSSASWRTMTRWLLPPDTSRNSDDPHFCFFLHWFLLLCFVDMLPCMQKHFSQLFIVRAQLLHYQLPIRRIFIPGSFGKLI